ncbi:MAG: ATP-binding protein, partial [Halopseudomonas sp.]
LVDQINRLAGPEEMDKALHRAAASAGQVLTEVTDPQLLDRPAIRSLPQGGVVAHNRVWGKGDNETYYFRLLGNSKVYHTGRDPDSKLMRDADFLNQVYLWSFFLITAFAIGLWTLLLHRKLKMLERSAIQIADGDFSARAPEQYRYRVGSLNQTFNQMAQRIEQLLASHKRLTNAVAHELRTPIFRLNCQLELLQHGIDADEHHKFVEGMEEDLSELDELVNELLSYARMERSGGELKRISHEIAQWLTDQQSLLSRSCRKSLELNISGPIQVKFDAPLLMRALNNLVRNADNYAQNCIEIRLYQDSGDAVICIDDDGMGIPEADRERVLQPFERVDNARTRKSGGHGLGLSIVKEIVKQHQGRLSISESPLGGTRISIYLPLDD